MTINLFQSLEYKKIIETHIEKTMGYLFDKNQEFALACETKDITFLPKLPSHIQESFDEVILFVISRYSLETANLESGVFSFEAGFGEENFGATVSMPLLAIKQLFVGDHPIVINLAQPEDKKEDAKKSSMEALLSNPENKKLLKSRIKS